jgi:hypothetical protein
LPDDAEDLDADMHEVVDEHEGGLELLEQPPKILQTHEGQRCLVQELILHGLLPQILIRATRPDEPVGYPVDSGEEARRSDVGPLAQRAEKIVGGKLATAEREIGVPVGDEEYPVSHRHCGIPSSSFLQRCV